MGEVRFDFDFGPRPEIQASLDPVRVRRLFGSLVAIKQDEAELSKFTDPRAAALDLCVSDEMPGLFLLYDHAFEIRDRIACFKKGDTKNAFVPIEYLGDDEGDLLGSIVALSMVAEAHGALLVFRYKGQDAGVSRLQYAPQYFLDLTTANSYSQGPET
ncbi:MAG TPA: hypothetical protein VLG37_04785 [Candidatus Saccharimonadales bacterium]|nr:hypothetical protein [Candidatus Saccharimonadales bacterium]